jgi:hypothetical protein
MADLTTNLYDDPPYPEITFSFTIGLYGSLMPSGQGHFSAQPSDQTNRSPLQSATQDSPPLVRNNDNLNAYNPYGVSGVLLECPQDANVYLGNWVSEQVSGWNDFGISTGSINGIVSFLRPAYSNNLKTSAFFKAFGIVNAQAHPLAADAAISGGRFHYLSNAYYYVTTKSNINFNPYYITNKAPETDQSLSQSGLANNLKAISQVSGVITDTLLNT